MSEISETIDTNGKSVGQQSDAGFFLAAIVESLTDSIVTVDFNTIITSWNKGAERLYGYRAEEVVGKSLTMLAVSEDLRQLPANIENIRRSGQVQIYETERIHKDGHRTRLLFTLSPMKTDAGEIIGFSILARDITGEKPSENALRETQHTLNLAMSASKMGAWSRNLKTEEVYWSSELEAIVGLEPGTFAGNLGGFYDFVHEEDMLPIQLEVQKALEERRGYVIEFRYRHADGSLRWMEGRGKATYADDGEPLYSYGIGIDITERKRAELNTKFLAAISNDLVGVSTPEEIVGTVGERLNNFLGISMCSFVEINETFETATINYEWHREDALILIGSYKLPEFVTSEFLKSAMRGEPIIIKNVGADSRIADVEPWAALKIGAHANIPLIRTGEWRFSLCVYHTEPYDWQPDEIELMRELANRVWTRLERAFAERERENLLTREHAARLQAEEASRLKDEFLATVSHELRTPLNAILGWSQLLSSGDFDQSYAQRAIETIYRNAKSQAQLIEDILDVSRIITGKLRINAKPISVAPIIQAVAESLRPSIEAKQIRLFMGLNFETQTVNADSDRLHQVVWNLLSNAVKFTPEKGQITVELESSERETKIVVSDTGKGIDAQFLPFVFDRFRQEDGSTTRAHGGLGLGLAIVRHIVELHGGNVFVRSDGDGKGTTFTVSLPVTENRSSNAAETKDAALSANQSFEKSPPNVQPHRLAGLRVLLIDDEKDALELVSEILARNGAEVRPKLNVADALETIKTWKPDVIISDIAMPEEDGYLFIKKLRSLSSADGGTIPVIALTAYVGIKERTQVLSSGFQMYIAKPVEPAELVSAVVRVA